MEDYSRIVEKVERFLHQQSELYGADIFFMGVNVSAVETVPGPSAQVPLVNPPQEGPSRDNPGAAADRAAQLNQFYEAIKDCRKCALAQHRTNFVFGTGNPEATLMFIGEGPGREEDEQGIPFVGPAGKILDRMISKLGFTREEVYIGNVVKCRPPQNRDPLEEEVQSCLPYLQKQIEIIQPRYLFCLGRVAAAAILKTTQSLSLLRGKIHDYQGIKVFVTYHPAALLRNRQLFWETFEDMKLFRSVYDKEIGDKPPLTE